MDWAAALLMRRVGGNDASRRAVFRGQWLQVAIDDHRGAVVLRRVPGQAGDMLEGEAVLQTLECLLNAPALAVKVAEFGARETLAIKTASARSGSPVNNLMRSAEEK